MASDLIATTASTWTPPEAQRLGKYVRYALLGCTAIGAIFAFNAFAPSVDTMLDNIQMLMEDTMWAAFTAVGAVGAVGFAFSLISPTGKLHKLAAIPYNSAINSLAKSFIEINPLSPIDQRIESVTADKEVFEANFERLDGVISSLEENENNARAESQKAQRIAFAARGRGAQYDAAKNVATHKFGSYGEAADAYAKMRAKLEPMRATFQNISRMCDETIQKLTIDRDILSKQWKVQQTVSSAVNAANRALGRAKTDTWGRAEYAASFINTKYGEELGHLDHLKRATEPLLQSLDLENATFDDACFQDVQTGAARLTQSSASSALPPPQFAVNGVPVGVPAGQTDNGLSDFIH